MNSLSIPADKTFFKHVSGNYHKAGYGTERHQEMAY